MRKSLIAVSLIAAAVFANQPEPRTRSFHFTYTASLKDLPVKSRSVELWMPVPHSDAWQQISNLHIQSPFAYKVTDGPNGNRFLHLNPGKTLNAVPTTVVLSFDAVRSEHIQSNLFKPASPFRDEDASALAPYLKPDRLVPIDNQIRLWAREVIDNAGAHTDLEKIRAIYNHVVATVKYDKTGQGWGRGDIYYACDARRGNCTDFHAIVIGYARALGIPARFAIGFPLPADRGEGKIAGYHCWAEVYAHGIGWIPIDASEAAKNPARREYFFGAHDENRIEFSKGRDVMLTPKQQGEPLNYFVYPYAEVDGNPFPGVTYEVSYRDLM